MFYSVISRETKEMMELQDLLDQEVLMVSQESQGSLDPLVCLEYKDSEEKRVWLD